MSDLTKRRMIDKNFGVSSFKYNTWSADIEDGQTMDDALAEQFWTGQAEKIMGHDKTSGVGDLIQIRKRETGEFMEVLVTAIGKGYVRVAPIRLYVPPVVAEPEVSPLTTRYNPGKKCHEVVRKDDRTIMASNFQVKGDAITWIVEHTKLMAA